MSKPEIENKPRTDKRSSGFVEDGLDRLLKSKWYKQRRAAIELEIREHYTAELKSADWWKQREVEAKIQRESQRELGKICSPYSLWIAG